MTEIGLLFFFILLRIVLCSPSFGELPTTLTSFRVTHLALPSFLVFFLHSQANPKHSKVNLSWDLPRGGAVLVSTIFHRSRLIAHKSMSRHRSLSIILCKNYHNFFENRDWHN
jgi:hypothetical protein